MTPFGSRAAHLALLTRRRDERGVVAPTRVMVLSISAVVLAGAAFVATKPADPPAQAAPVAASPSPSASATPTPTPAAPAPAKKRPVVKRGETYVEVFNNSGITGLAGETSAKAQDAGWNVVGTGNWYGTVDSSTVYYPTRLLAAAKALGRDLGIARTKPAISPMRLDRLTVILTRDYQR